jgi:ketosteroid isomerase-like protein
MRVTAAGCSTTCPRTCAGSRPRRIPIPAPTRGTYEGYAGVEHYWAQWRAAVGQLNFVIEEIIDAGRSIVVVARRQGRGEHSGLEISDRVIQVFHFDDDAKCTEVHEYYDRDAALSAVGGERPRGAVDVGPK